MIFCDTAKDVITEVERRLKRSVTGAELEAAQVADAWNPSLPAYDEEDVEALLTYLRPAQIEETTDLEPGVEWSAHSREVMRTFSGLQRKALISSACVPQSRWKQCRSS